MRSLIMNSQKPDSVVATRSWSWSCPATRSGRGDGQLCSFRGLHCVFSGGNAVVSVIPLKGASDGCGRPHHLKPGPVFPLDLGSRDGHGVTIAQHGTRYSRHSNHRKGEPRKPPHVPDQANAQCRAKRGCVDHADICVAGQVGVRIGNGLLMADSSPFATANASSAWIWGMTESYRAGTGEGVAHSSVRASHGSPPMSRVNSRSQVEHIKLRTHADEGGRNEDGANAGDVEPRLKGRVGVSRHGTSRSCP